MKKKIKLFTLFTLAALVVSTGVFAVFATQDNELGEPHEHIYAVSSFDKGTVVLTCTVCGESYADIFAEHLNEFDNELYDINYDGIVNGKDYAYLSQHKTGWKPNNSSGEWEVPFDLD